MSSAVIKRTKLTTQNLMRASSWIYANTRLLGGMTLDEIAGAINGQAKVDQTMGPMHVRRLLEAAGLAWKSSSPAEARLKLQGVYDKILQLQGRIEIQDEAIAKLQSQVTSLTHKTDSLIENTNWVSAGIE